MKKLFFILLAIIALTSCERFVLPPEEPYFHVGNFPDSIEYGECPIMVYSETSWAAESNKPWVTIYPDAYSGYTRKTNVMLTVKKGPADSATITFTYGEGYKKEFKITRLEQTPTTYKANGWLPGKFSVSNNKKIVFSKGNLQYKAVANTWRFAAEQYEIVGSEANENISYNNSDWIDLFGWGTGNNPTMSSTNNDNYSSYTSWWASSRGRALSSDEWEFLLSGRANAEELHGRAQIEIKDVKYDIDDGSISVSTHTTWHKGVVLLPDNFKVPENMIWEKSCDRYSCITYSMYEWKFMEAAGAVFLPESGYRYGKSVHDDYGYYWTSTKKREIVPPTYYYDVVYYISFYGNKCAELTGRSDGWCDGMSVRLVKDVE